MEGINGSVHMHMLMEVCNPTQHHVQGTHTWHESCSKHITCGYCIISFPMIPKTSMTDTNVNGGTPYGIHGINCSRS